MTLVCNFMLSKHNLVFTQFSFTNKELHWKIRQQVVTGSDNTIKNRFVGFLYKRIIREKRFLSLSYWIFVDISFSTLISVLFWCSSAVRNCILQPLMRLSQFIYLWPMFVAHYLAIKYFLISKSNALFRFSVISISILIFCNENWKSISWIIS